MKNIHIATYHDTGKQLADVLPNYGVPVVIRLGGYLPYEDYPIQINSSEAVKNCTDKLRMKQILINGDVITLPLLQWASYPMVIKGIKRSQGKLVFVVNSEQELVTAKEKLGYMYYSEPLFQTTSEYRLHATQEKVFFAVKKIMRTGHENDIIVNSKNHFNKRDFVKPNLWKEMQEECVKGMKVLNLEIGAFDIMYDSSDDTNHKFTLAEVNTSPELLNNTLNAYAEQIDLMIKAKIKNIQ